MNGTVTLKLGSPIFIALLFVAGAPLFASRLQDALDLESKGKLKESKDLLRTVTVEQRAASDLASLARALSASSRIAISLGDYREAIQNANEAVSVRTGLKDEVAISEDYNTLGLANLDLGNYDAALSNYEKALSIDRQHHQAEAEVVRLNNIGNVFYFRGRYQDALRAYQQAMNTIDDAGAQAWVPKRRQLTVANLAALYQRLGNEQTALQYYRQLTAVPSALPRAEYAQLLVNEGVLYRRMGDPVKALERYRSAQTIFAEEHHRDAEIGALRNIGIVRAMDLGDLEGSRDSFTVAMNLARQSSNARGIVTAALYHAEVLRRLGRLGESKDDLQTALAGAQKTGLVEEQWKSEFGLGKLAEAEGDSGAAEDWYRRAIAGIESVRAGMRRISLRSEFLADKREVYDALIALALRKPEPPLGAILSLMEHSRARSFEERSQTAPGKEQSLPDIQAALPVDTILVEFWEGEADLAALWISRSGSGIVRQNSDQALRLEIAGFEQSLQTGDQRWKLLSLALGKRLLAGIPAAKHLVVAPDGSLAALPLETLTVPGSGRLLMEDCDVSYIPAARFLTQRPHGSRTAIPPWRTQLVAYGDPPLSGKDALGQDAHWQPLSAAAGEIHSIAGLLPGRSEVHLGMAARKHDLLSRRLEGISLLHFSTHAMVDAENPDRSRILMASDSPAAPLDYLFQREIYGLDLRGVDLATISACETARGQIVRGDGVQAFSQAFLAAGASATVTSLWQVADRPTAEFMKQFYYFLGRGQAKSEALRSAKLQFIHSNSRLAAPQYWSAFILNGNGWDPCVRVIPWSWLLGPVGALLLILGIWLGMGRKRKLRGTLAQLQEAAVRA